MAMYDQVMGSTPAEPYIVEATGVASSGNGPFGWAGRCGMRCSATQTGPTPGPPPPGGMEKDLCRLRCETSPPNLPGCASPTSALSLAPSMETCPPALWILSEIS